MLSFLYDNIPYGAIAVCVAVLQGCITGPIQKSCISSFASLTRRWAVGLCLTLMEVKERSLCIIHTLLRNIPYKFNTIFFPFYFAFLSLRMTAFSASFCTVFETLTKNRMFLTLLNISIFQFVFSQWKTVVTLRNPILWLLQALNLHSSWFQCGVSSVLWTAPSNEMLWGS